MKVKLESKDLALLFGKLQECGYDVTGIALFLGKNRRTIADWRRGKFNMSATDFNTLIKIANLETKSLSPFFIDESERRRAIARLGGLAQWEKNGSIGTIEDKKRAGESSYLARKNNTEDIFSRTKIRIPTMSSKLAEFIGISMGDGSLTTYQATISLNSTDDANYINYVTKLAEELFGICPKINKLTSSNCTNIVFSSVELIEFLQSMGLPKGDKIRANLDIPEWIRCDDDYTKNCLRGLFDTDGSVYLETHNIDGRIYSYPRLSFVSVSEALRESVFEAYLNLGIGAKIRMNRSVNIERFTDVEKYFKIVGSSNTKHLSRIAKYGGVG